jgi:hypothetical protein
MKGLSSFYDEVPDELLKGTFDTDLFFNPFRIKVFIVNYGKLLLFCESVEAFYTNDNESIAINSPLIGECSLFLNEASNFN